MDKELMINQVKDILIKWCENRQEKYGDIIFEREFCTGKTFIRFSTKVIDEVLMPTENNDGAWNNGRYMFYEISNRINKIKISCLISREDLLREQEIICENLMYTFNKEFKKDWKFKFIETWDVYIYGGENEFDSMENILFNKLDSIRENEIVKFEEELIKTGFTNSVYKDVPELTSIVSEYEGMKKSIFTTKYERCPKNRLAAIKWHGTTCMACGFNFEKVYGDLGKDFIEVHHIKPLASMEEEMVVNPKTDLICICSNCHSMIHRYKDGILSIEDLKKLIK